MKHYVFILILFVFLAGCHNSEENIETIRLIGDYVAHIQLDSSQVIATEIANGLDAPRDIKIGPDGWIWYNEIRGSVYRVNPESGEVMKLLELSDVFFERARGLLSLALHPEFPEQPYVYLHYTFAQQELGSRIVRYTFAGDSLTDRHLILDNLPGGSGHSGSKMMIGPENKLWLGTGDAHQYHLAQDRETYHGKVLRMNLDGSVPDDNPIEGSRIWTTGHRNVQGLTYGNGKIYSSEHGPSNDDEVNQLKAGGNYGWPDVHGYCNSEREQQYCRDSLIVEPIVAFTPVIAASGIAYYDHDAIAEWSNSLLLVSLRIQALRILHLDDAGEQVGGIQIFFQQYFGRIRDVTIDSQGRVFLLTSNTDWYREFRRDIHDPDLAKNGDRIIMLRHADETLLSHLEGFGNKKVLTEDRIPLYLGDSEVADNMGAGERLYVTHCASCHHQDGTGMEGVAPSLVESEWISGNRNDLVKVLLNGFPEDAQSDNYEWGMPVFRTLSNDELAAILNFIRSSFFSSETDQFRPDDIQEIRDLSE